jgi:heme A synthase
VQALTLITLFITFDLVLFGAFTRLTDSGLGCPDWPGCYGHASPVGAQSAIAFEQSQMPDGPVTHTKAWIEMVHRYMAMAVGGLILTLAAFAWVRRWRSDATQGVLWPTVTLLWVCVQGAFGALTVTMKLFPLVVDFAGATPTFGRSAQCIGCVAPLVVCCDLVGFVALDVTGAARWLGQYQLCGAGLQHLSAMPRQLVALDEL